jgi:D-tagatose-1,6-bisphosphate aldolase subunit GatZ/KbaZ
MEEVMLARPKYWDKHYRGDAEKQHLLRRFSYSDRIRYYWPEPEVHAAADKLLQNLEETSIPETLLSGILPDQIAQFGPGVCDLLHVNWLWIKYGKHCDPTRRTAMVSES